MILAMDLGNTSLTAAVFFRGRVLRRFKVPAGRLPMLRAGFRRELGDKHMRRISLAVLATVNPSGARDVERAVAKQLPAARYIQLGRDVPIPVVARVDKPEQVGADRLLATLAAFRRVRAACIVVDLGTAITVDAVSSKGEFLGGVIAPGIGMCAEALHARTALLPRVAPRAVRRVIGKNTVACMQSGLYHGVIAMVEGLVARVKKEHPSAARVLATGGDAKAVARKCKGIDDIVPDLVLEGIALVIEGERRP